MAMLAFFPWLRIEDSISADSIRLLPYVRGSAPIGEQAEEQLDIDSVLEPYWVSREEPVDHATLAQFADHGLTDDLSRGEIQESFQLAEVISFAALSSRNYFALRYWNRDNFTFTIQGFSGRESGALVQVRRRDGSQDTHLSKKYLLVTKPVHVTTDRVQVDTKLLNALLKERQKPEWAPLWEAIQAYNAANTDSLQIAQETELVLLNGAFERLLESGSGKEADLAAGVVRSLKPWRDIEIGGCDRFAVDPKLTARFKKSPNVRDAWIRDFFRLRNDLAHGKLDTAYPSVWTLREHLLLASFVFPLLMRALLSQRGSYKLTEKDQLHIDAFESLACTNHFIEFEIGTHVYPWQTIIRDVDLKRRVEEFLNRTSAPKS